MRIDVGMSDSGRMAATERPRRRGDSLESVLQTVLALGAAEPTYDHLASVVGVSRRTIDNVVNRLRARGLIQTHPLGLGPALGFVLSVALGSETCRAGLVDANGALHCDVELERASGQRRDTPEALLRRIRTAATAVLERASRNDAITRDGCLSLLGVATAWPAPVRGNGRPAGSVLDPAWLRPGQPNLRDAVADALGLPRNRSHALNDANAHGLAVAFDDSRVRTAKALHHHDLDGRLPPGIGRWRVALILRIGGAIGASTLLLAPESLSRLGFIDSIQVGGARSLAGELAHFPIESSIVNDLNNRGNWVRDLSPIDLHRKCSCGCGGHLEAYAGGDAFMARMEESGIAKQELLDLLEAVRASQSPDLYEIEDRRIVVGLEDLGRLIGRTLTASVLLLDPHLLMLTGSLGVRPVLNGIETERGTWRDVFGDALRIDVVREDQRAFLGVRGAALAVHRAHVHRRLEALVQDERHLEGLTMKLNVANPFDGA